MYFSWSPNRPDAKAVLSCVRSFLTNSRSGSLRVSHTVLYNSLYLADITQEKNGSLFNPVLSSFLSGRGTSTRWLRRCGSDVV